MASDTADKTTSNIIGTIDDIIASVDTLQYEQACIESNQSISDKELEYYKIIKFIGYNQLNKSIPTDIIKTMMVIGDLSEPWEWAEIYSLIIAFNEMSYREQMRLIGGEIVVGGCRRYYKGNLRDSYCKTYRNSTGRLPYGYLDKNLENEHEIKFETYLLYGPPMTMEEAMAVGATHGKEQWKQFHQRGGRQALPFVNDCDIILDPYPNHAD